MIDENKKSESRTTTINFSADGVKNILTTNTSLQVLDTIDAFSYAVNNIVEQESTALKSRLTRIQEQLGCPIGIFFKALKYGIIVKTPFWQGKIYHVEAAYLNGEFCFGSAELLGKNIAVLPVKEFNKTWWAI